MKRLLPMFCFTLLAVCVAARAEDVSVAVAANFTGAMQQLAPAFERTTGHKASVAFGATGKFYAQIKNGAPFDVLISADQDTPSRLVADGLAQARSTYTYAIGSLVLWSSRPGFVDERGDVLERSTFSHLSIANPKLAPYGAAAVDVLNRLGIYATLENKLVLGETITQAYQFVATGNAELGFVALSQIYKEGRFAAGSYWIVPQDLYAPLKQDAVLLDRGKDNPAAIALLEFLKSEDAKRIIRASGYDVAQDLPIAPTRHAP